MEHKINGIIKNAKKTLDDIADTHGVLRATHITLLAQELIALRNMLLQLLAENAELRKQLETHGGSAEANEKEVP